MSRVSCNKFCAILLTLVIGGTFRVALPQACTQDSIDLEKSILEKVTRASVRVATAQGSGSGIIIKSTGDTAYIVASSQIVALNIEEVPEVPKVDGKTPAKGVARPPKQKQKIKETITVVFNGGTAEEKSLEGEVVVNDSSGLAMIRVSGGRKLPEAIDLNEDAMVAQGRPVYVVDFPSKKATESAAVRVKKTSVAEIRRNQ